MSSGSNAPLHRRKKSDVSFEIDDADREFFYQHHGRPEPSQRLQLRPSRLLLWILIGIVLLLVVILISGRREKSVDWSRYAYTLYATDTHTLCNALLVFEALKRLGSKADRVLQYPREWDKVVHNELDRNSQLLLALEKTYKVRLLPVELLGANTETAIAGSLNQEASWDTSITKLAAFQLTTYDRLLHLDSDITLLQHLDDLFLLPPVPVAMPRAYWTKVGPLSDQGAQAWPLTSLMILLKPSTRDFQFMMSTLNAWRTASDFGSIDKYDMDLLNHRFGSSAMVLPQRPYALLSSEFRSTEHSAYLGEPRSIARWDPDAVLKEAKLVHFSDWPLPKPWTMWSTEALVEMQPQCSGGGECRERKIWKDLYDDFRHRRRDLCKILSVPAPDWERHKAEHGYNSSTST